MKRKTELELDVTELADEYDGKLFAVIGHSENNVGCRFVFKDGDKHYVRMWHELTRDEQCSFINDLGTMYSLFSHFLKPTKEE